MCVRGVDSIRLRTHQRPLDGEFHLPERCRSVELTSPCFSELCRHALQDTIRLDSHSPTQLNAYRLRCVRANFALVSILFCFSFSPNHAACPPDVAASSTFV